MGNSQIQVNNSSAVQQSNVQVNTTNKPIVKQNLTCENAKTAADTNQNIANTPKNEKIVTKTDTGTSFTLDEIKSAAATVKAYIESNKKLPDYVTIGTTQVKMPDFLKLMIACLLEINNGTTTPITLKTVNAPPQSSENVTSGNINKTDYLDIANRINNFIDKNGAVPNYTTTPLGKVGYQNMVYMFSRILNFQKTNNCLPNYVTMTPWNTTPTPTPTPTPIPEDLKKYLVATTNCQVDNPQIQALAKSITSGKTSAYDKAAAIFQWVNDHTTYEHPMYSDTRHGAVGTLQKKMGNCCDLSHLVIAIERAAGIPARYEHVYAKFSSGNWYGHVIAQVWVDGKWYNADASSSLNTFGVIKNWNTATATIKGTYASLPF